MATYRTGHGRRDHNLSAWLASVISGRKDIPASRHEHPTTSNAIANPALSGPVFHTVHAIREKFPDDTSELPELLSMGTSETTTSIVTDDNDKPLENVSPPLIVYEDYDDVKSVMRYEDLFSIGGQFAEVVLAASMHKLKLVIFDGKALCSSGNSNSTASEKIRKGELDNQIPCDTSSSSSISFAERSETTTDSEHNHVLTQREKISARVFGKMVYRIVYHYYLLSRQFYSKKAQDGIASHAEAENSRTADGTKAPLFTSGAESSRDAGRASKKGKKRARDEGEDDQDGTGNPRKPVVGTHSGHELSFACQFYKADPGHHNGCRESTLMSVSAVRQHHRRKHLRPSHYCTRCFAKFKSQALRDRHMNLNDCVVTADPYPTVDEETYTETSKKRLEETDREWWFRLFAFLFPDTPWPDSPYADLTLREAQMYNLFLTVFREAGELAQNFYNRLHREGSLIGLSDLSQPVIDQAWLEFIFEAQTHTTHSDTNQRAPLSFNMEGQEYFDSSQTVPAASQLDESESIEETRNMTENMNVVDANLPQSLPDLSNSGFEFLDFSSFEFLDPRQTF